MFDNITLRQVFINFEQGGRIILNAWYHRKYSMSAELVTIEFFFEMHKNGNSANIGIRDFATWKQKKIQW